MVIWLVAGGIAIYLSYHTWFGTRKPIFVGGNGHMQSVVKIVSSKAGNYCPTSWSFGGHVHTVIGNILKSRPKVNYITEQIETPDGGLLRLEWSTGDLEKSVKNASEDKDIVLIIPGLTGTAREKYVLHFVKNAQSLGYRAVVMAHRGTMAPPKTYRMYCAANTDDLELALQHIRQKYPRSRVCAVGVSLGGLILTNYLVKVGSTNQSCPLLAALIISIPWDLFIAERSFVKPLTWLLFNRHLTRKLQSIFTVNVDALRAKKVMVPEDVTSAAAKANTLREFDGAVIAPMFGYDDVNDYYRAASVSHKVFECVKTPLLCLNAADDPLSPLEQIPVERIQNCENVALILTHTGGHVGFLEGILPTGQGYMGRVFKEYIQASFETF